MAAVDRTAALPAELLARTLEELDFAGLQPIMRVCRRWRQMGVECIWYWRDITLDSVSLGSIRTFYLRRAQVKGRPFRLFVSLPDPVDVFLEATLFPAIAQSLHYTETLSVKIRADMGPSLFSALMGPAENLVDLRIVLLSYNLFEPLPVIPGDIFGGEMGVLRTVCFFGVQLDSSAPAPAFSTVSSIWMRVRLGPVLHGIPVHMCFPSMRKLSLTGSAYTQPTATYGNLDPLLDVLHLSGPTEALEGIFAGMDTHQIPHITVHSCPAKFLGDMLAAPLHGELQLFFRDDLKGVADGFTICIGDLRWAASRAFGERQRDWQPSGCSSSDWPHGFFHKATIFERIVRVTVPSNLWAAKMALFQFPMHICELRIIIARGGFKHDAPAHAIRLGWSRLRKLILRSDGTAAVTVPCKSLASFIHTVLVGAELPLNVDLENVRLEGHVENPCPICSCIAEVSAVGDWSPPPDIVDYETFPF
ncbi:hypothetical protein AURDEDRAFT_164515 [Auricularia subglabra TFB-10046 SS5]|nr:hypothetical protein AURDEDRAFT_164515 [Auricularia subglabra TFB-10046 SS5]